MSGRLASTHSTALVLSIHIAYVPECGGSVHADAASSRPGDDFMTLCTAMTMDVPTAAALPLGASPNSSAVRQRLAEADVEVLAPELVGNIGVAIQLIVEDGSMRSVAIISVESEPSRGAFVSIELHEGDVVHVAASDIASAHAVSELSEQAASLPPFMTLVVSVFPAAAQVPVEAWEVIFLRADVVTMSSWEAATLVGILDVSRHGSTIRTHIRPDVATVRRVRERECELQEVADALVISIPVFQSRIVGTAGVSDIHTGEMCAGLAMSYGLETAYLTTSANAALAISYKSTPPVSTRDQIENVLETGVITNIPR